MSAIGGVNGTVCTADQYSQSLVSESANSSWISCLTHGQSIGLAVSICLICLCPELTPCTVQLTAEASIISCVCVIIIFIWICVRPTCFHMSFLFDEMLHSGTYDGIERSLGQMVTGSCSRGRLTSTWCAQQLSQLFAV